MLLYLLGTPSPNTHTSEVRGEGGVGGGKILVGMVVKEKVGELEDEVREEFSSLVGRELTDVVKVLSYKRKLLVRFKDLCEKYLTSNQLTIVIVESIPMTKESEVPTISVIPDETIYLYKWYYHGVYFLLHLNKGGYFDRN